MRLLNFRVKNFRGIGEGNKGKGLQIDLTEQDIVFLIGKNNVGKSSLLHAYDYFFNDKKVEIDDFLNKDIKNSIEIELLLELTDADIKESFSLFNEEKDLRERYCQTISFTKIWKDKDSLSEVYIGYHGDNPEFTDRKNNITKKKINFLLSKLPEPIWIKGMSSTKDIITLLQRLVKSAILDHLEEKYEEQFRSIGLTH